MSILFSRSTRALNNDNGIAGLILAGSMMLIVLAWLMWFFLAQVPLYKTSQNFSIRRDGRLMVQFSQDDLDAIRPGQEVIFLPQISDETLRRSYPGRVMDTPQSTNKRDETVEIYIEASFSGDVQGEVRVVVDYVSPFALLTQSAQ